MAVKMRYVPTSGSLSGMSFEKQTERAFNELGVEIDDANATAAEALDVATQAENNSNQAILGVQAATEAANDASLKADAANGAAQQAVATANAAQTAANNANDQSATAMANAQTALSGVADANATANNALSVATQARGMAQTASAQAQTALSMFANGMAYTVTPDDTNLNTIFLGQRLYLTGTVNNAPIAVPFYLDVVNTNDVTGATQRVWCPDSPQEVYSRSAVIVNPTSQNPSVTWGAWQSSSLSAQPTPPIVPNTARIGWTIGSTVPDYGIYGMTARAQWTNYDPIMLTQSGVNLPLTAGTVYILRLNLSQPITNCKGVLYCTMANSSDNLQFALYTAHVPQVNSWDSLAAYTDPTPFKVGTHPTYSPYPGPFTPVYWSGSTPVNLGVGGYMLTVWSNNATTGALRGLAFSAGDAEMVGALYFTNGNTTTTPLSPSPYYPASNPSPGIFWVGFF